MSSQRSLDRAAERWKFRLRMALALRDAPSGTPATADELDRLVDLQTAHWRHRPALTGAAAHQALQALNDRSISAFIFTIRRGKVQMAHKREFSFPAGEEALRRQEQLSFARRAMLYRAFLEKLVSRCRFEPSIEFALDVRDMPEAAADVPIFGFQKERGASNLLLPDVDFFHSKWYRGDRDTLAYEDKTVSACFVGASTGGWHSVDSIRRLEAPRLRAAAYFRDDPRVFFRIAKAVQCLSEDAERLLRQQPYFCDYVSWAEQLRHRFIISLDGNGAACSRLVKGLQSNSVLIKFDSPHELYYFPALVPGRDFIPVDDERGVERVLDIEAADPGAFKAVAESGRQFFARYLTIGSVMDYSARLLKAYAELTGNRWT